MTNDTSDDARLRLAVQKSGRLADDSFDLLERCGLKVRRSRTELYARIEALPIDLLLVRDDDIPGLVASGASDLGIVGGNVFEEEQLSGEAKGAQRIAPLGFSRCRLCIAVRKGEGYEGPKDLAGLSIATSYPAITGRWLEENGSDARTVMMTGAVEIAPRLGIAEAICDIVSTGATLDANGLRVAETIFRSEALLIGSERPLSEAKKRTLDALTARIQGVMRSRDAKYVMMNAPRDAIDAIRDVLPGADAPTVIDLAGPGEMVALHVLSTDQVVWEHLEELKGLGASAILVLDVDKMLS
ncbi:ATP phosphoribosyltransferase [Parvularcula dongshanensis]|uniref:ATP phosphoribosyltransferase n=1 Tax=Parvularcula dongshanensis TaxID=1173995 RepID=A0A840I7P2_9PROT|nr:ATP phosphoribosyltransferase [Parvularcula dongshanensis]MBB4659980.1 ATP phosphoribosyltransferase [Parvularcula dongshanensis]